MATTMTTKAMLRSTTKLFVSSSCRRSFSSFSAQEVSKFSEMSSSWWDNRENPLIAMNPIRLQYVQQHAITPDGSKLLTGCRSLDVGCGGGLLSESLARLNSQRVVAIDPSEPLVACAKAHSAAAGLEDAIDYRGGVSIEQLAAEEEETFDVVCILEVLEHATNVDSMLEAAAHLLDKDSGRLFISTLNKTVRSHLLAIVGAEYIMGYLPPGTHDHSKFLSPELVKQKLKQFGLEEASPPMGMVLSGPPPPLGSWQWELSATDLNVNWIGVYQHIKN